MSHFRLKMRLSYHVGGHAWVSTTQVYTYVVNDDVKRAMQGS